MPAELFATTESGASGITRIAVKGLFGVYDYDIEARFSVPAEDLSLLILYGDNGTGKTTLLKLTYRLLSPEANAGHRTFVRSVPFSCFRVELGASTYVEAVRDDARSGPFRATISRDGQRAGYTFTNSAEQDLETNYSTVERLQAMSSPDVDPKQRRFLDELARLGPTFHYLSDDRRLLGARRRREAFLRWRALRRTRAQDPDPSRTEEELLPVEYAVLQAQESIKALTIRAADRGAVDTNQIYTQVVEQLSGVGAVRERAVEPSSETLKAHVAALSVRSTGFARFGLTAALQPERLAEAIGQAEAGAVTAIQRVLEPYLAGLEARLDALQRVQTLLSTLIGHLNTFFSRKTVTFTLADGFQVENEKHERLQVAQLSSGERQLLLLLCTFVAAHERQTVFLIDEPEISLNIKWQRALLSAMLDCMRGSRSQLIVASHSVDVIGPYASAVAKLSPDEVERA